MPVAFSTRRSDGRSRSRAARDEVGVVARPRQQLGAAVGELGARDRRREAIDRRQGPEAVAIRHAANPTGANRSRLVT